MPMFPSPLSLLSFLGCYLAKLQLWLNPSTCLAAEITQQGRFMPLYTHGLRPEPGPQCSQAVLFLCQFSCPFQTSTHHDSSLSYLFHLSLHGFWRLQVIQFPYTSYYLYPLFFLPSHYSGMVSLLWSKVNSSSSSPNYIHSFSKYWVEISCICCRFYYVAKEKIYWSPNL